MIHTPTILLKLILTFKYRNTIINLTVTAHTVSSVKKINSSRSEHICKNFVLALLCSIAIDTAFDALATILVMVPVDAVFSGG